jgi:hypothetical protein
MTNFNYKKFITENKLTNITKLRSGMLNEGQFSWMTQDTGQQIGSEDENTIPVYMFDNTGKYWFEPSYEGYGVFGGVDYYELLDQMNGGKGDRDRGIDLAFDKEETSSPVLFPALVTSPSNFNYKNHDFTKEPESDPNQSWYAPEEDDFYDQNDEEVYGYEDDEEELDEGKAAYEYEKGKKVGEKIEKTKMKKSELKAKIKEMIVAETNSKKVEEVNFLAELEGMLDEADGLTPLQDYVYQYEIEISGEDRAQEFLDDIKKLNTPQDVYDYYAYDRDWSGSMDDDLNNIFRQVSRKFKNLKEASEFDTNKPARIAEFITALNRLVDDYHAELYLNDDLFAAIEMVIKAAKEEATNLNEAAKDEEVDADVEAADDTTGEDTTAGEDAIDTTVDVSTNEVDPNVKAVQDALTQAQAAAQQLGDPKLTDQIGNTITFFTRSHVVEKPTSVAEAVLRENTMIPIEPGDSDYDIGYKTFFVYEDRIGGFDIENIKKAGMILANKIKNDNKIKNTDEFFRGFMDSWNESSDSTADKEDMYEAKKPVNEVMFPMLKKILK